jgi:hypothetical protein
VQETVDTPPDTRLVLDGHDALIPDGAETDRLTGPDRPERLVRVNVPFPEEGGVKETDDAEIVKSRMETARMIEWLSDPLVAENVTL